MILLGKRHTYNLNNVYFWIICHTYILLVCVCLRRETFDTCLGSTWESLAVSVNGKKTKVNK